MSIASGLLPTLKQLAIEAGEAILDFRHQPRSLQVQQKADHTPFTQADLMAHQIVADGLSQLSDWPVLSEEGEVAPWTERQHWQRYWLVDPLDGTRGFIRGEDQFTVNIALIESHQPVLGVIYVPCYQCLYWAGVGDGAWQQLAGSDALPLQTRALAWEQWDLLIGYYYNENKLRRLLAALPGVNLMKVNSSYKFGLLAAGAADVYARVGPTSEWDTAAGHCILQQAGGVVVDLSGQPLQYNASESLRNPAFMALGDPAQKGAMLKLFEQEKNRYDPTRD